MGMEARRFHKGMFAVTLLLLSTVAQGASVTLSLADGARVSDTVTVTASVVGFETTGVRQVVFRIDNQPVAEDTSVPYSFIWDTLVYTEGQHTLEAIATDMEGNTARASVNVVVDNELTKGAEYHGRMALEALERKDLETARRYARRANTVDPNNLLAARALASLHASAREYNQAIRILEQCTMPEDEVEARRDLMALYLLRADMDDTTESFLAGVSAAYEQQQRLLAALKKRAASGSPAQKGDLAFAARNWREAMIAYQSAGDIAELPMPLANRLLLTYARAGRWRDCDLLLRTLERDNRADPITRAVQGFYLLQSHRLEEARRIVQPGVDSRLLPALVVAAAADLILGDAKRAARRLKPPPPSLPKRPLCYTSRLSCKQIHLRFAAISSRPSARTRPARSSFFARFTRS